MDKCKKCDGKVYTVGLCEDHYREEFNENKKGLFQRFKLK